jgi:hypothetical protein
MVHLRGLRWFPILPLLYTGAIAAVYTENWGALRAVAVDARLRDEQDGWVPLLARSHLYRSFQFDLVPEVLIRRVGGVDVTPDLLTQLAAGTVGKRHTGPSDFLHTLLRERFQALVPDDGEYEELFDRVEILLALLTVDLKEQHSGDQIYVDGRSFGRFTWRTRSLQNGGLLRQLRRKMDDLGEAWPLLGAGLFGGKLSRAVAAFETFTPVANEVRDRYR